HLGPGRLASRDVRGGITEGEREGWDVFVQTGLEARFEARNHPGDGSDAPSPTRPRPQEPALLADPFGAAWVNTAKQAQTAGIGYRRGEMAARSSSLLVRHEHGGEGGAEGAGSGRRVLGCGARA